MESLLGILKKGWFSIMKFIDRIHYTICYRGSQIELVVKNPPANAGDTGDVGSIPGLGRSPETGNGTPLQYSCLENSMDRGSWRATVHGAIESQT